MTSRIFSAQAMRATALGLTLFAGSTLTALAGTMSAIPQEQSDIVRVQMVTQDGASQRINLSGKLRMISQRVTGAACYAQSGIDVESSTATLGVAAAEFELIAAALEFGNDDLGVFGAEERRNGQAE